MESRVFEPFDAGFVRISYVADGARGFFRRQLENGAEKH